jgi:hypothetical protein
MNHYEIAEVLRVLDNGNADKVTAFNEGLWSEYITEEELLDILEYDVAEYVFNTCEAL